MLLLDFEQALVNKIMLLFGLLLNCTTTINSCVTTNWVRTYLFELSLELCQWVVIEGLKDILGGKPSVTLKHNLTNCSKSECDGWRRERKSDLSSDHQEMYLPFVLLIHGRVKDNHLKRS